MVYDPSAGSDTYNFIMFLHGFLRYPTPALGSDTCKFMNFYRFSFVSNTSVGVGYLQFDCFLMVFFGMRPQRRGRILTISLCFALFSPTTALGSDTHKLMDFYRFSSVSDSSAGVGYLQFYSFLHHSLWYPTQRWGRAPTILLFFTWFSFGI